MLAAQSAEETSMAKGDSKTVRANAPKAAVRARVGVGLGKVGRKAMKLAGEPVVSEVVAAAMLAAAAALRDGGKSGKSGKGGVAREVNKLGDALRALAIDVARQTLDALEERSAPASKGRPSKRRPKA
jgi:hypothetical protein